MNIVASLALLQSFLSGAGAVSDNVSTETISPVTTGEVALLPCNTGGELTPLWTTWMKDEHIVASKNGLPMDPSKADPRYNIEPDGTSSINEVRIEDSGSFSCSSALPNNRTINARFKLQVTSGPVDVSTQIYPTVELPNGTQVAVKGTTVYFKCFPFPNPSQVLNSTFSGPLSNKTTSATTERPSSEYFIENIQPRSQGVYNCSAINTISNRRVTNSTESSVYYVPGTHPDCMFVEAQDTASVQSNCSWFGAYPTPKSRWDIDGDFHVTDNLSVKSNSSTSRDKETVTCTAQHQSLKEENERSCSITLRVPDPQGKPLVTVLEGTNVTLTCSETMSQPIANTTWRKGQTQDPIVPGSKYASSVEGPVLKSTIVNISQDDESYYFCRSENALGVRELEVYLTVKKSSSAYTGAVIGVFIAASIVGCAFIVAKILYSRRHTICLGGGFIQADDRGDVSDSVESDDEQIFQDTVPQSPPLANGRHTTLVQIHRIPSSDDHEDADTVETNPQPPEKKEEPTEEPRTESEDLVSI